MEKENKREHEALGAIKSFVTDLVSAFRTNEITPLIIYDRFLEKLSLHERISVKRLFNGFDVFLRTHRRFILENKLNDLPNDVRVGYSPRVYLEIQKFVSMGDEEIKFCIRRHLLTIMAIMMPSPEVIKELEKSSKEVPVDLKVAKIKVDETTKEGKFVKDVMTKLVTKLDKVELDSQDPVGMMMQLAKSGIMGDLQKELQGGKGLNQRKLLMTFRGMIDSIMPEADEEEEVIERSEQPPPEISKEKETNEK